MAQALGVAANPWTQRRRRCAELIERWPFAVELLAFYTALLEVQENAWANARIDVPRPFEVVSYSGARVLQHMVDVSLAKGPPKLVHSLVERSRRADFEALAKSWLEGGELAAVDRYLVRATIGPVLEAIGAAAGSASFGPRDERHCPNCGGSPQLSYFATSAEDLVTAQRYLECERCAASWAYPRMTCAACGETKTALLPIFGEKGTTQAEIAGRIIRKHGPAQTDGNPEPRPPQETPRFPHIRIDACRTCSRYLLSIDLGRDARAVPVVDELAAVPLDLYAKEQGMTKIVPNLMGF